MKKGLVVFVALLLCSVCISTTVWAFSSNSEMRIEQQEITYQETKTEELPKMIQTAIAETYSGYELQKSFIGNDGSYKLILKNAEESIVVFFNAKGEFVKQEKLTV